MLLAAVRLLRRLTAAAKIHLKTVIGSRHLRGRTAVAIRSGAVLLRKAVPANGSGTPAGAAKGCRENGYSQCENTLGGVRGAFAKGPPHKVFQRGFTHGVD